MSTAWVECVPNFSDGRSPEWLDDVAAAVARSGARVLDASRDEDHNRSVLTYAVPIERALDAGSVAIELAVERIDVRDHDGVHPRIGAVDVFPFVPLGDVAMEECVALAHALGRRVGTSLDLPVFYYGDAARVPLRRSLPFVRKGGLERVRERAAAGDPEVCPDEGPRTAHPTAGFCAIGARPFLVAWNVNLDSTDLATAQAIARSIRESSGGLPGVRALGLRLERAGRVQVSMNLCDHATTGLVRVFDEISRLAGEHSVPILDSELIGLAPRSALDADVAKHVRLRTFDERPCVVEDLLAAIDDGGAR